MPNTGIDPPGTVLTYIPLARREQGRQSPRVELYTARGRTPCNRPAQAWRCSVDRSARSHFTQSNNLT